MSVGRRSYSTMSITDLLMAADSIRSAIASMRSNDAGAMDHVRLAARCLAQVECNDANRRKRGQ